MTPSQTGPWTEHRMIAETIGQAVADAVSSTIGSNVDLGKVASFVPETALPGRPLPLRAIVVRFHRPLRDVMVFITSNREEQVRPMIEAAAAAAIGAVDVPTTADQHGPLGRFEIEAAVELDSIETVLEQCDALFLEAAYSLELPTAELQLIVGTGLLESAACFVNGVADEFSTEPAYAPASNELELADDIQADTDIGALELATGVLGGEPAAPVDAIAAYEATLAEQEAAEAANTARIATAEAAQAAANAAAAALPDRANEAATQRWTQLLSGVEVELSAELGRAELTLGDITSLASESVLTLDQMVHEPVCVYVNGTRYATARLVVVDGEYGIEILDVVEQNELMTTLAA